MKIFDYKFLFILFIIFILYMLYKEINYLNLRIEKLEKTIINNSKTNEPIELNTIKEAPSFLLDLINNIKLPCFQNHNINETICKKPVHENKNINSLKINNFKETMCNNDDSSSSDIYVYSNDENKLLNQSDNNENDIINDSNNTSDNTSDNDSDNDSDSDDEENDEDEDNLKINNTDYHYNNDNNLENNNLENNNLENENLENNNLENNNLENENLENNNLENENNNLVNKLEDNNDEILEDKNIIDKLDDDNKIEDDIMDDKSLNKLKINELKDMAHKLNIDFNKKKIKTKQELINNILEKNI